MLKLNETIQKSGNFRNLSYFHNSVLGLENKVFFSVQFLVDILPLGSGYLHIFADSNPGSQNFGDPTDTDPNL